MSRLLNATLEDLRLEFVHLDDLQPHPDNPRKHPHKQIRQIAKSIEEFGFRTPVLIDGQSRLICGHGHVEACRQLAIKKVPALRVTDLSDAQVRALMIADNRLTEISQWDDQLLAENLKILSDLKLEFDIESIGFDYGDIEQRIIGLEGDDNADEVPDLTQASLVCQKGDLWTLGNHRLLCSDCTQQSAYQQLLGDERAAMIFTDPPYNLPARDIGRVCADTHGDFAMAAGEMSIEQFTVFLGSVMVQLCRVRSTFILWIGGMPRRF